MKEVVLFLLFMFTFGSESLASVEKNTVSDSSTDIKVRAYSRVFATDQITLHDVVEAANLTPDQMAQFKKIKLGDAPQLGEQRSFASQLVAQAIREQAKGKKWTVQIPHAVVVENKGYDLDRENVEKQLLTEWKAFCADCELNVESLQLPAVPEKLSNKTWQLEAGTQLPRGSFSKKITILGENGRPNIFWVNGKISVRKRVPVLTRSLQMNTRVGKDDIAWEWREVTYATDSNPSEKEIVGQKAKFSMNAKDILWRNSLAVEKAVQRGEVVKVYVSDENWQVSVSAVIEQDGYIGDTVNLRNVQTQKLLTGRVVGMGEVEIK